MKKDRKDHVGSQEKMVVSIEEYRQLLNDHQSTDERIKERIQFIQSLCRNVIRVELEKWRKNGNQ